MTMTTPKGLSNIIQSRRQSLTAYDPAWPKSVKDIALDRIQLDLASIGLIAERSEIEQALQELGM